jgi:tRNA(fMet)-specific endonuclease VapC
MLIDSSVLIAWKRDQHDIETELAGHADEDFAISAITASELLHGVHRATTPARRSQEKRLLKAF